MKRIILFATCSLMVCAGAFAQQKEEPKLVVKPSGRILMDAGAMHSTDKTVDALLNDGAAIPDARIGFSATYDKWKVKVDVGFARQSLSLKDINLDYKINNDELLRLGYFVHQFGLQSATSSSFKISMEEPLANQAFFNNRLIGAMYVHTDDKFHATASLFAENDAMKMTTDKLGNEAWGAMTRLVWHPQMERGKIFHFGVSGAYESPRYNKNAANSHSSYTLRAPFPTRIANVSAQEATITDAKSLWKFSPELTAAFGNLGIESQYYYVAIKRDNALPNYKAWGAYGNVRYLLKGQGYTYTKNDAGIATPDPGAMELVAAYNYSTLTDKNANIFGGKVNDWSLTFNYYINKYMIWRVRASITRATENMAFADNTVSMFETRLQIKF